MAIYDYQGLNAQGKKVSGRVEAQSEQEVINKLRAENINILDIKPVSQKTASGGKIKIDDLVVFARQFSSLISAGIPLVRGLNILEGQIENKNLRDIVASISKNVEAGGSLADSLAKYPQVFSPLFINMVNVGEFSGSLDIMLDRLALYLESYSKLVKKVQGALMYPIAIVVIATLIVSVIMIFVVPGFKKIFESMGGQLPLPTQILINISNSIRHNALWLVLGIVGVFFGVSKFIKTPKGVDLWEKVKTKMPIIGPLYTKMVLARFTKTLATLVKSGVPILNALVISGKTSGSAKFSLVINKIKDEVSRGKKIGDAMKDTGVFPNMVVSMVGVGEEGGDLSSMLDKIAEMYETDVNNAVEGLLSMLEPLIIVFLGVIIGGIVISLFLPILNMSKLIQH